MPQPSVLFTSPAQPIGGCSPNVYSWDKKPPAITVSMNFLNHPGLSFLRANVPCQVLEYPTWESYCRELVAVHPEILGISFHINETAIAIRMAEFARRHGVKEIWAGNYGAYSPQVVPYFDRVVTGWGESQVSQLLGHRSIPTDQIRHPLIYGAFGTNLFPRMFLFGLLFTSRGCPYTCSFCQTPDFYGRSQVLSLAEIDRVLGAYDRQGITGINILDENFGIFPSHANAVIDLLCKYKMRWVPLCRVDCLLKNFDDWRRRGLVGAHLGVESLNPDSLVAADKRLNNEKTIQLLNVMSRFNLFVQAF